MFIECAGKTLRSSVIQKYKSNPNFTTLVDVIELVRAILFTVKQHKSSMAKHSQYSNSYQWRPIVLHALYGQMYMDTLGDNTVLPSLWQQFWGGLFLFQHDNSPVHKARSIKKWFSSLVWKSFLNPIQHLWDEREGRLSARFHYHPTSMLDITKCCCIVLQPGSKISWKVDREQINVHGLE